MLRVRFATGSIAGLNWHSTCFAANLDQQGQLLQEAKARSKLPDRRQTRAVRQQQQLAANTLPQRALLAQEPQVVQGQEANSSLQEL